MRTPLLALALAGSALTAGAAVAQSPPAPMGPPPGAGLMAADANHDGIVTRTEYLGDAAARFAQMDTDNDGRVTPGERDAYREAVRDRRIADGAPPPPPGGKHGGMGPEGHGPGGPGGPGGGRDLTREAYMARAAERFDRMDVNHDGQIDRTEMANLREMRRDQRRGRPDDAAPPPPPPAGAQ